ncbi:hypothetical protein HPB52_023239 [Rhipicephalus sanguineus]|uniref:CCHC-type domain-containing protein n=1 Tax=Rhipicephalus sanguineus TaxID=34632 RepID=A0A9D4PZ37_RHISA|nr:hypothetical protein HPB52_023239 [Rhipicephalus sanguineus]
MQGASTARQLYMAKTSAAPTRASAASHARPKALKTPIKKSIRPKTDHKAQPDTSNFDQAEMECQDSEAGDCITHQDNEGNDGISGGKVRDDDGGWQTVLTVRKKKALAKAGKKLTTTDGDCDFSSPPSNSLAQPTSQRRPYKRKLPPLPKEDFKVVVRPCQGLPISELTAPQIAEAVVNACQGKITGSQFLLRLKPGFNIFIISTPDQEVADMSRKITGLTLNGRLHAVNAYAAVGDGTRKGVIHGITPNASPDTLLANLRIRTQGVDILRARMLGETKTAVITFFGSITPRFVYYMGCEVPCYPFKNTIQFCYACKQTGHRTDVCPTPHITVCHRCGMKEPQPDHPCNPVCSTCGEGHLTGTKECKQRFKQPGAGGSRELNPAAVEQGSGHGTRGDPYNISP